MYLACFSPFEVWDVDSLLGGGNSPRCRVKKFPMIGEV